MLNLGPIGSGEFLQAWLLRGLSIYFFSRALVVRWLLMVVRRGTSATAISLSTEAEAN